MHEYIVDKMRKKSRGSCVHSSLWEKEGSVLPSSAKSQDSSTSEFPTLKAKLVKPSHEWATFFPSALNILPTAILSPLEPLVKKPKLAPRAMFSGVLKCCES